jgi:Carboxypeptidase regulatory-like domain
MRTVLSWLAVAFGLLIGLLALAQFGMVWLPDNDDPGWLVRWIQYAGIALFGVTFLTASITALRDRKRAGFTFLAFMPVTVFCLAYPSAGYLVWHADGSGWFETPEIPTAVGLSIVFFLPIYATVLVLHHRKRSFYYLFALTLGLAGIVFAMSHWTRAFLPPFAGCSALFLAFGLFWWETDWRGWPCLLQRHARSLGRRITNAVLACVAIICLDIVATFLLSAMGSSLYSGDCGGKPIIVHPESVYHAVFTARVVFTGRSIEAMTRTRDLFQHPEKREDSERPAGDWAIGIVQERFWGIPAWSRFVLLTNSIYWKGETYFVDGSRERGILNHSLPIVDGRVNCSRTRPAQDAQVDLRVLRQRDSSAGSRLVGYVREPKIVFGMMPPVRPTFAAGMKIRVTGPTGTSWATTDQAGIYEADHLPPGDYTLTFSLPDDKAVGWFGKDGSTVAVHLAGPTTVERSFDLLWNGRIEGHVTDASGKPVKATVRVLTPKGIQWPGALLEETQSASDGSYQIAKIPPGRYSVMMEILGGGADSKIQFYPSKSHAEDAQWLDLAEGQRITGIDFKLQ